MEMRHETMARFDKEVDRWQYLNSLDHVIHPNTCHLSTCTFTLLIYHHLIPDPSLVYTSSLFPSTCTHDDLLQMRRGGCMRLVDACCIALMAICHRYEHMRDSDAVCDCYTVDRVGLMYSVGVVAWIIDQDWSRQSHVTEDIWRHLPMEQTHVIRSRWKLRVSKNDGHCAFNRMYLADQKCSITILVATTGRSNEKIDGI